MAAEAGVDAAATYAPARAGELQRNALDPGRAGIQLGWRPWTTLADGTNAVLRWFAERAAR
jgi:nucleoside-diphosphate-sugar epimerase